jgi:hypothetical protein
MHDLASLGATTQNCPPLPVTSALRVSPFDLKVSFTLLLIHLIGLSTHFRTLLIAVRANRFQRSDDVVARLPLMRQVVEFAYLVHRVRQFSER